MSVTVDRVVLRIRSQPAAANAPAVLEPIIESHVAVIRAGGFSNPEHDHTPEFEFEVSGEPLDLEFRAQSRFVDRGAWRVLLDALRGELALRRFGDYVNVQCSLFGTSGDELQSEEIAALPYPASPATPPFASSWTEEAAPRRAAAPVYFLLPPDPEMSEEIGRFFMHWQRLIRAYRPRKDPQFAFGGAVPTEAVWSHPRTFELDLDTFIADEAVFHPIVNYACWLQRRAAIQELLID
jgi:hypothetical protein